MLRWVRAIALIAVGLVLLVPAGFEVRAASQPERPAHNHYLNKTEAKYAELHQGLELHRVCTETGRGRWNEWPCNQIKP